LECPALTRNGVVVLGRAKGGITFFHRVGTSPIAENLPLNSDDFSYLNGSRQPHSATISAKALVKSLFAVKVEQGALVFPPRCFPPVVLALFLIAGAFLVYLFSTADSRAEGSSATCMDAPELAVLPAPMAPWTGAPLRVLVVAEQPLEGELLLIAPDGSVAAKSHNRHGGPPYFWYAEIASPTAGKWRAMLAPNHAPAGCNTITRQIAVRSDKPPPPRAMPGSVWPVRNTWNRATENLYSAWIEKLFDAPLDVDLSWPALDRVLRDRSRNFLFDYLSLGEDEMGLVLRPDCAKLPYLLRAYFAFKMGLPFGYSKCTRGDRGKPPTCYAWFNIQHPEVTRPSLPAQITAPTSNLLQQLFSQPVAAPAIPPAPATAPAPKRLGLVASFGEYLPTVFDAVQSGNGRTPASDDSTDFYPVPLTQGSLRPGTIYADPYGHILMLVRRVPQSGGVAGEFLAADAEPDGTVARKLFWRGNFLFAQDPALGSPGFKRFRPIVRDKGGVPRRLTNREITKNPQYADFSLEQSRLGVEDFYDRMDEVMSPEPLDPLRAMEGAIAALDEQVKLRVTAVENGRKFQNSGQGEAAMPDGRSIFQTSGAWEDFSTPARDFRLLIAIDVVRGFPDRVARQPQRFAMPKDKNVAQVKAELQNVLASELETRKFAYTRSDGSSWTLSLKDVIDRAAALEMAYNPNDCVEVRWGAPPDSDETSTCKRYAPAAQRAKMIKYRTWFQERHWPTHA
jgi:hypothetical protein